MSERKRPSAACAVHSLRDVQAICGGEIRGNGRDAYLSTAAPGHSKRDRGLTLRLRSDGRGVVAYGFNCNAIEARDFVHAQIGIDPGKVAPLSQAERERLERLRAKEVKEREARQLLRCHGLAADSVTPEPGAPVRNYLRTRQIPAAVAALAVNAGALREQRDEQGRACMLALAHNLRGDLRGVQLTKLRPDGSGKRGTECDRLTFGPVRGSACRLFKTVGDTLAVAEGVETALGFYALNRIPTWATFGTANLQAFEPPRGVTTLHIAADGDAPGIEAAKALAERLKRRVRCIVTPAPDGLDWLDVLTQGGAPCR